MNRTNSIPSDVPAVCGEVVTFLSGRPDPVLREELLTRWPQVALHACRMRGLIEGVRWFDTPLHVAGYGVGWRPQGEPTHYRLTHEGRLYAMDLQVRALDAADTRSVSDAFLTVPELAKKWHVDRNALAARLKRARKGSATAKIRIRMPDWSERTTPRRNEARHTYRERAVYPIIANMPRRPTT